VILVTTAKCHESTRANSIREKKFAISTNRRRAAKQQTGVAQPSNKQVALSQATNRCRTARQQTGAAQPRNKQAPHSQATNRFFSSVFIIL